MAPKGTIAGFYTAYVVIGEVHGRTSKRPFVGKVFRRTMKQGFPTTDESSTDVDTSTLDLAGLKLDRYWNRRGDLLVCSRKKHISVLNFFIGRHDSEKE
jgi:hypothetical protein